MEVFSPRYSHLYSAVQNRPSLLVETHSLKAAKTRAWAHYDIMRHAIFSESHYEGRKHAPPDDPYHSNSPAVNQGNLQRVAHEMLDGSRPRPRGKIVLSIAP